MSVFIVTATHTNDDYKRPYVSTQTEMATSREDAVVLAVDFYLDQLDGGCWFDHYDPLGFNKIVDQHRSNPKALMPALLEYFENDPEDMFAGEYVPKILSVTISESESIPSDVEYTLSTIDEIIRYIKEEREEA